MITSSTNASSFRKAMQSRAANLRIGGARRIVLFAQSYHGKLVQATPKLTGKATAEWQLTLNGVPTQELLPRTRPPTEVDYGAYAQAADAEVGRFKSGDTIYITNLAPYINALNAGSSRQAAANFVQVAEAEALAELRATVKVFDD